jgi:REP element-mobilizing transposase RayT
MGHTYTRILLHVVFSTKDRFPFISPSVGERLFSYIGGIVKESGGTPLGVNGFRDHVHVLMGLPSDTSVASMVRTIKTNSSRWVHETFPGLEKFAWQSGYSAFSVDPMQCHIARTYIENQAEHHRTVSFQEEIRKLLLDLGVQIDERYMWI